MGEFTWLGGDLGDPSSWTQPDAEHPVEPGETDSVDIVGTGNVSGSVSPFDASVSGNFTLLGTIASVDQTTFSSGTLIVKAGATLSGGTFTQTGGTIDQGGGTVSATGPDNTFNVYGRYELHSGAVTAPDSFEFIASGGVFIQRGGTNTAKGLDMIAGSYTLAGGSIGIGSGEEYVGSTSGKSATFTQSDGTQTLHDELLVGYAGTGKYTLSGGTLKAVGEYVGQNGTGAVDQTGGKNVTSDRIVLGINLDNGVNGTGTYTLGGNGALQTKMIFIGSDPHCHGTFNFDMAENDTATMRFGAAADGYANLIVGGEGIGKFNQGGGKVSATDIAVGFRSTGIGTYTLTNGDISAGVEWSGYDGSGSFIQQGGTNTVANLLELGLDANSVGDYSLKSGALTTYKLTDADKGDGHFIQDGGTVTVSGAFAMGAATGATGIFDLNFGTLTEKSTVVIGLEGDATFVQRDGTNSITGGNSENTLFAKGNLCIGDKSGSTGTYTMTGGTLTDLGQYGAIILGNAAESTGTFKLSSTSGTATASTRNIYVGNAGKGDLTLGAGGKLLVVSTLHINSQSVVNATSGEIVLGTATAQTGIAIGMDGVLEGTGRINADIHETSDGKVIATGGTLTLNGAIDGGGVLRIASEATLSLKGTDSNNVFFLSAAGLGTLALSNPASFTGKILNMSEGSVIDLVGISATGATLSGGTLTVTVSGGANLTLHVQGAITGLTFKPTSDGHGGTNLTLVDPNQIPPHPTDSFVHSGMAAFASVAAIFDTHTHIAADFSAAASSFIDIFGHIGHLTEGHLFAHADFAR